MQKLITFLTLSLISTFSFAEINTQYPGNPAPTTPAQVDTKPPQFYTPQKPLNQEAVEANQTIKDNSQ